MRKVVIILLVMLLVPVTSIYAKNHSVLKIADDLYYDSQSGEYYQDKKLTEKVTNVYNVSADGEIVEISFDEYVNNLKKHKKVNDYDYKYTELPGND